MRNVESVPKQALSCMSLVLWKRRDFRSAGDRQRWGCVYKSCSDIINKVLHWFHLLFSAIIANTETSHWPPTVGIFITWLSWYFHFAHLPACKVDEKHRPAKRKALEVQAALHHWDGASHTNKPTETKGLDLDWISWLSWETAAELVCRNWEDKPILFVLIY